MKYALANLLFLNFLHPDLPGLFADNRLHAVNGALWTLKIEVMFSLSVPLLVYAMRRWGHWQVMLLVYATSILYVYLIGWWGEHDGRSYGRSCSDSYPVRCAGLLLGVPCTTILSNLSAGGE